MKTKKLLFITSLILLTASLQSAEIKERKEAEQLVPPPAPPPVVDFNATINENGDTELIRAAKNKDFESMKKLLHNPKVDFMKKNKELKIFFDYLTEEDLKTIKYFHPKLYLWINNFVESRMPSILWCKAGTEQRNCQRIWQKG